MTLQGYMDESIDDETGLFVLAGYVSTAERWASFSEAWERELPNGNRSKSGGREFKMSQMARWPGLMGHVPAFQRIIHQHALVGLSIVISSVELKNAIERISIDDVIHGWMEELTPYYVSLRLILEYFTDYRVKNPDLVPVSGPIDMYFDDIGEKAQVINTWDRFISSRPAEEKGLYGATPRFENDQVFLPLQAADFHAWWARKWAKDLGIRHSGDGKFNGISPIDEKIFYLSMGFDEDGLFSILKSWIICSMIEQGINPVQFPINDLGRKSERY